MEEEPGETLIVSSHDVFGLILSKFHFFQAKI